MTPTYLEISDEQYHEGSSDRCEHCHTTNYFLVPHNSVSYQWQCKKCNELNKHPSVKLLWTKTKRQSQQITELKLSCCGPNGVSYLK